MIKLFISVCLLVSSIACTKNEANSPETPINIAVAGLSDTLATYETKALYAYLKNIMGKGMLFGQQFSTYYRQSGTDDFCTQNISDSYTGVGDHPAILGVNYDFDPNILRAHIINAYKNGSIVTVHWTMPNPVTGKDAHDVTPAVYAILKGGEKYSFYKTVLNTLASFFKNLKDNSGKQVPVIFRPFHENTGDSKWWGESFCTPQEYVQLFRQTVSYLRDTMQVHNVIYAYAPSDPGGQPNEPYTERYPGDDCVDIIGFDKYGKGDSYFAQLVVKSCRIVVDFAKARNKVAAITEAGIGNGIQNATNNDFFMENFLLPILNDPVAKNVAYFLTWTNTKPTSYWVPLPTQPNFESFKNFYNHPYTLFQKDLPKDIYTKINY